MKRALKSIYSTKIYYTPPCPFAEVGLSFIWDPCGRKTFLFLLCGTFDKSYCKQSLNFAYAIGNQAFESKAVLMKGGQVAELDAESSERIFQALMNGSIVVIEAGPYQSVIQPCDFVDLYKDRFGIKNCVPRVVYNAIPIFQ
jgi:hypothetical protein